MQADLPHTLFKNIKGGGKSEPSKKTKASAEVLQLQEEANRKYFERKAKRDKERAEGKRPYTIDELFN